MDETKIRATHKERLMALLDEAGVGYELKNWRIEGDAADSIRRDGPTLKIQQGYEKVGGYFDFYCEFHFDEDGNLTGVGCWE